MVAHPLHTKITLLLLIWKEPDPRLDQQSASQRTTEPATSEQSATTESAPTGASPTTTSPHTNDALAANVTHAGTFDADTAAEPTNDGWQQVKRRANRRVRFSVTVSPLGQKPRANRPRRKTNSNRTILRQRRE